LNVPHPKILPIIKHMTTIIMNLNIHRSQVKGGERFSWLLLKGGSDLTSTRCVLSL